MAANHSAAVCYVTTRSFIVSPVRARASSYHTLPPINYLRASVRNTFRNARNSFCFFVPICVWIIQRFRREVMQQAGWSGDVRVAESAEWIDESLNAHSADYTIDVDIVLVLVLVLVLNRWGWNYQMLSFLLLSSWNALKWAVCTRLYMVLHRNCRLLSACVFGQWQKRTAIVHAAWPHRRLNINKLWATEVTTDKLVDGRQGARQVWVKGSTGP